MSEKKDWTVMVYMSGDNNLSVDMAYSLENIYAVAKDSSKTVNILVYFDGYSRSIPTLYCDFSDYENPVYLPSYQIANKKYPADVLFNENSASKYSVLNFVDWCVNAEDRRAEKYGLIFSGHSFGFQGVGLLKDESTGKTMSMDEVYEFLKEINGSIIGENKKLEVLGFDSCVMSMLEVGYQFKDVAETLIASEGSVPRAGWAYAEILGHLAHSTKHETINDIAEEFVRTFITKEGKYTLSDNSVDMAAWDLNKIVDLNAPFERLSERLYNCFVDRNSTLYKQMKRVLLQVHKECQSYMLEQNVDLGDFCELLKSEVISLKQELGTNFRGRINSLYEVLKPRKDLNSDFHDRLDSIQDLNRDLHGQLIAIIETLTDRKDLSEDLQNKFDSVEYLNSDIDNHLNSIAEACDEVLEKIRECVLLAGFSGGAYQFSNGISLFFPWSMSAYNTAKSDYESLHFIRAKDGGKAWNKFLKKYLGEVTYRQSIAGRNEERHILTNPFHWANAVQCKGDQTIETNGQTNKMAHSIENKMAHSIENKMSHSIENKMSHSIENKMSHSIENKMSHSIENKMSHSIENKMSHSIENKMGGGAGHYFEFFEQFDNTEMPWNISGFTKKSPTDFAEKKDDGKNLESE